MKQYRLDMNAKTPPNSIPLQRTSQHEYKLQITEYSDGLR